MNFPGIGVFSIFPGIPVNEAILHITAHSGIDHHRNLFHFKAGIKMPPRLDQNKGIHLAEPLATRDSNTDFFLKAPLQNIPLY